MIYELLLKSNDQHEEDIRLIGTKEDIAKELCDFGDVTNDKEKDFESFIKSVEKTYNSKCFLKEIVKTVALKDIQEDSCGFGLYVNKGV